MYKTLIGCQIFSQQNWLKIRNLERLARCVESLPKRFPGVPLQPLEHLSFNELRLLQITICMSFACNLRLFATFHKCGAKLHVLSQFLKFFARYFPLNLTIYISLTINIGKVTTQHPMV